MDPVIALLTGVVQPPWSYVLGAIALLMVLSPRVITV